MDIRAFYITRRMGMCGPGQRRRELEVFRDRWPTTITAHEFTRHRDYRIIAMHSIKGFGGAVSCTWANLELSVGNEPSNELSNKKWILWLQDAIYQTIYRRSPHWQ